MIKMKKVNENMETKFGVGAFDEYTFLGEKYLLIEDAFLDADNYGKVKYFARAIKVGDELDEYGYVPVYMVEWEIIDPETEDGGNACDWENPDDVKPEGATYSPEENRYC